MALQNSPLVRSDYHLIMRRGFMLTTYIPGLIDATYAADAWSAELAETVVAANEQIAHEFSALDSDDALWSWVNSDRPQTAQGVPLRKSLYSLTLPLNPKLLQHLRYLRNVLAAEHNTDEIADVRCLQPTFTRRLTCNRVTTPHMPTLTSVAHVCYKSVVARVGLAYCGRCYLPSPSSTVTSTP